MLMIPTIAHIDVNLVNLKQQWNVIASSFSYTLKTTKRQPDWPLLLLFHVCSVVNS